MRHFFSSNPGQSCRASYSRSAHCSRQLMLLIRGACSTPSPHPTLLGWQMTHSTTAIRLLCVVDPLLW